MKLGVWLKQEELSFAEFGRRLGCSGEAVRRYAEGIRIPDREAMPKIVSETSGDVTANDFFDIDISTADETTTIAPSDAPSSGKVDEISQQAGGRA